MSIKASRTGEAGGAFEGWESSLTPIAVAWCLCHWSRSVAVPFRSSVHSRFHRLLKTRPKHRGVP